MPDKFLNLFLYILSASLGIAALVTLIALGATIFAVVFAYVFVPLLILAGLRWLWVRYYLAKHPKIEYFRDDNNF